MLKYLHIENIAVIEKADIEFGNGFCVLTGETGAGKSVIIDALNAVLGERTSKSLIRSGTQCASVTALFSDIGGDTSAALSELGFPPDEDGSLLLKRVIGIDGNSSARINGVPATATVLRKISAYLVNIHGQHDEQQLLNPETHYSFIDAVAENTAILKKYTEEFARYKSISRDLRSLTLDDEEKSKRTELLKYQIEEISAATITVGETEKLERQSAVYRNYDKLIRSVSAAFSALDGGEDDGAVDLISSAAGELQSSDDREVSALAERLGALKIEAEDIRGELDRYIGTLDFDPEDIDRTEKRLSFLHELYSKYGKTEAATLEYLSFAQKELDEIAFSEERAQELEAELERCSEMLVAAGKALTDSRKRAADGFSKQICEVLSFLNMPHVRFEVNFDKGKYTKTGCDVIEFLISANIGEEPKPLGKIASGGELSRIMLAIKSVLSDRDAVATLIFDEIDTGISGRAAQRVGEQLKRVSVNKQVICVTHLAQIAAKAASHYYIEKNEHNGRTVTEIKLLDFEQRKQELARIIGGQATVLNLKAAEEMLNNIL